MPHQYVGRFAPSPTGNLHLGSLIGALASFLDARANNGRWLLRIEDIDPPREVAGASLSITQTLQQHGLHWDGDILWQSRRLEAYQQVLDELLMNNHAFYCCCSRRQLSTHGGVYPGTCRARFTPPAQPSAVRLKVSGQAGVEDGIQGQIQQDLPSACGDFVLRRKDQLFAYQLAVVVDDEFQGITHIVRGADILDSTPRQVFLQRTLDFSTPTYRHFPVITNSLGQKLSKQNLAAPLDGNRAVENLRRALDFLQQTQPPANCNHTGQILEWAINHWALASIPRQRSISDSEITPYS